MLKHCHRKYYSGLYVVASVTPNYSFVLTIYTNLCLTFVSFQVISMMMRVLFMDLCRQMLVLHGHRCVSFKQDIIMQVPWLSE